MGAETDIRGMDVIGELVFPDGAAVYGGGQRDVWRAARIQLWGGDFRVACGERAAELRGRGGFAVSEYVAVRRERRCVRVRDDRAEYDLRAALFRCGCGADEERGDWGARAFFVWGAGLQRF